MIVPPGIAHVWGNPFEGPAAVIVDLRPALRAETFFETFFGLARDGKVNPRRNLPKSLLQTALLFPHYRADVRLSGLAGVAVGGVSSVLAPLARHGGIAPATRNTAIPIPLDSPVEIGTAAGVPRMSATPYHREGGGRQAGRGGRRRLEVTGITVGTFTNCC